MIRKNIYFGNNLLPGIVTVIALDQFLIISTTQYFKNFYWKKYFADSSDNRINTDLCDSFGYSNEVVKPIRHDSKLTLSIELKSALVKELSNGEYLYMLVDGGLTSKYKTYTIRSQEDTLEEWKEWNVKRGIWHLDGRR